MRFYLAIMLAPLLLLGVVVWADTIVMRDGSTHRGIVEGEEEYLYRVNTQGRLVLLPRQDVARVERDSEEVNELLRQNNILFGELSRLRARLTQLESLLAENGITPPAAPPNPGLPGIQPPPAAGAGTDAQTLAQLQRRVLDYTSSTEERLNRIERLLQQILVQGARPPDDPTTQLMIPVLPATPPAGPANPTGTPLPVEGLASVIIMRETVTQEFEYPFMIIKGRVRNIGNRLVENFRVRAVFRNQAGNLIPYEQAFHRLRELEPAGTERATWPFTIHVNLAEVREFNGGEDPDRNFMLVIEPSP